MFTVRFSLKKRGIMGRKLRVLIFMAVLLGSFCHVSFANDDDNTPKSIKLGLDVAKAIAEQKDVKEGLKAVANDELSNWLWDSIGGYEKFIFQNSEAEIPAAKDKIKKIIEVCNNIEAFTLAILEGRYDDALFTAIDQTVSIVDHPLVSVTWAMTKLTYESHKQVVATQAALEIETLYGMMSNDRRLMGVIDPGSDTPPVIPETAASADYFFDKYVMTNDSARAMLKSYVEKVLGDTWPEQSWSDYMQSWMAVGSGVDTARSAEVEALATDWRNKGRAWISQLIKDVNKQAKVAWGETRVGQQMAEFKRFSDRVAVFYNEDFEQMLGEFSAIQEYKKQLPAMRLMPQQSKEAFAASQQRFNKVTAAMIGEAGALLQDADDWSLKLLQASSRAMILREEALAKELSNARNMWLGFKNQVSDFIGQNFKQVATVTEQVFDAQSASGPQSPESQEALAIAAAYYSLYKPYLQPFEWDVVVSNMTKKAGSATVPPAEPKDFVTACLELIDQGQISRASGLLSFWSEAYLSEFGLYRQMLGEKVLNAPLPSDYLSEQKSLSDLWKMLAESEKPIKEKHQRLREELPEKVRREGNNLLYEYEQADANLRAQQSEEITKHWAPFSEARAKMDKKESALAYAQTKAGTVAGNLLLGPEALYQAALVTVNEALSAYGALAGERGRQYNLYIAAMAAAERDLPVTAAVSPEKLKELLPLADPCHVISSINVALQALKDNVHTAVGKFGPNDGDVLASLPSIIQTKAGAILAGVYPSSSVSAYAVDAERMKRAWLTAAERFQKFPDLNSNDVKEIQAFVDGSFDPAGQMTRLRSIAGATAGICNNMMNSVRELLQLAATDGENRQRDVDWLMQKSREVQAFIDAQVRKGYFESGEGDYRIAVPQGRVDGMVLASQPFPHVMTASELGAYAASISAEWSNYPGYLFITQYAPLYEKKLKSMARLSYVTPAREENFISPVSGHILYKGDLENAFRILSSLQEPFPDYAEKMAQVADLVPGLLRAMSARDRVTLEQKAKEYGMSSVEEYVKKTTGRGLPAPDYSANENIRDILKDPRLQHDLGRAYIEVAKQALAKNEDLVAFKNKESQDQATAEVAARAEADKKKAAQELVKQQEEYKRRQGYSVGDAGLNSFMSNNLRGDVLLTKDDMKQGMVEFTGLLNQMIGVTGIQISIDGGRTWGPINATQKIKYTFTPEKNISYSLRLRVIADTGEKYDLNPFPNLNGFVYLDVAYQQAVAESIQKLADTYEQQNVGAFGDGIAEGYLGGKGALVEGARFDFEIFQGTRLSVGINRIEKQRSQFIADIRWDKTQSVRSSGEEHKTSGRTTMIFVFEDDRMKIYNLRGDLLFAALSPEIAKASGLRMDIVAAIQLARDNREPFTEKARSIEDIKEKTDNKKKDEIVLAPTLAVLPVKAGAITSYSSHNYHFDFSDGVSRGDEPFGNDVQWRSDENHLMPIHQGKMKVISNFDALSEAPDSSTYDCLWDGVGCLVSVGKAFVFISDDGYYGKMEVTGISGSDPKTITFKYAIQMDRTWNIRTK